MAVTGALWLPLLVWCEVLLLAQALSAASPTARTRALAPRPIAACSIGPNPAGILFRSIVSGPARSRANHLRSASACVYNIRIALPNENHVSPAPQRRPIIRNL